jgi:Protein kinase domain
MYVDSSRALPQGTVIEGYSIERVLGQGGMGVVYEATDLFIANRRVALKLIGSDLIGDPRFRERFKREAEIQATLEHPHIVTVYRAGESEYGLYIAMRLIHGPNLKDVITARELDPGRALRLLSQVADALDMAHEVGLIHRDIKPYNILVDIRRDHAFLADFGITKARHRSGLTGTRQMIGTPDYISPEQIRGEETTERSDIYSLAAVLFESLTGSVPYAKESDLAVLYAHVSDPVPKVTAFRPELPPEVDAVIEKAMAKNPADRHASASELMADFERSLGPTLAAAMTPPPPIETAEQIGIRGAPDTPEQPTPATQGPADVPQETRPVPAETPTGEPTAAIPPVAPPTVVPEAPPTVVPEAPREETAAAAAAPEVEAAGPATVVSPEEAAPTEVPPPPTPSPETHVATEQPAAPPTVASPPRGVTPSSEPTRVGATPVPPTLAGGGEAEAAPTTAAQPVPRRARERKAAAPRGAVPRPLVAAAIAILLVAVAVGGLLLGRSGTEEPEPRGAAPREAGTPEPTSLSTGAATFTAPAGWRSDEPAEIPGLELRDPVGLVPDGSDEVRFVAGGAEAEWPTFLPAEFREAVPREALAGREIVRLGEQDLEAFRYPNATPEDVSGALTVYAVPQPGRATLVACMAGEDADEALLAECEAATATLALANARPYPLAPSPPYAQALDRALGRLDTARRSGAAALAGATTRAAQATAARSLATAYGTALAAVRAAAPPAYARPIHAEVVDALRQTRAAYVSLAGAATPPGDEVAYERARRTAVVRDDELRMAIARLGEVGYRVG